MSRLKIDIIEGFDAVSNLESALPEPLRIFQRAAWLAVTGGNLTASVCYDDQNQIKGYLPMVQTKKFGVKGFHIPPYTPYFGPLIYEKDVLKKSEIIESLIKPFSRASHIDFVIRPQDNDIVNFSRLGFTIEASQTHIIDVKNGYDLKNIHSSKRRYVKKLKDLENNGKFIILKGKDAIEDLKKLNIETEERAGFRGNRAVLNELLENFGTNETVFVICTEANEPLAGAFCPADELFAYHVINASSRHKDNLLDKANLLSAYKMAESAVLNGKSFDFEGSNIPGVAAFYRMMGGVPAVNYRIMKSGSVVMSLLRSAVKLKKERYEF